MQDRRLVRDNLLLLSVYMIKSEYMERYDEGLGTVYERFMLNNYFDELMASNDIKNVLEIPVYGMTGLTGINSVHLAMKGCKIVLADARKESVKEARELLEVLPVNGRYEVLLHEDMSRLPFRSDSFELVWNFAAIRHVGNADLLLNEMARVSSKFVLVFIPNRRQLGYILRKYIFDRRFFDTIDETWIDLDRIKSHLKSRGMRIEDEGLIDIPVWPDTAVPVKNIFRKIIKEKSGSSDNTGQQIFKRFWNWDIMNYYMGNNPGLKDRISRLSFLERMPAPWHVKVFWAHHQYVLCSKN
ncbi:MAG: class I SAM-dependent methyltransferase [Nitrospiraceae bacterium]|nr:MAG: class I SAM-dependent methyltransferase [Nitrospiraceae bacterium]